MLPMFWKCFSFFITFFSVVLHCAYNKPSLTSIPHPEIISDLISGGIEVNWLTQIFFIILKTKFGGGPLSTKNNDLFVQYYQCLQPQEKTKEMESVVSTTP